MPESQTNSEATFEGVADLIRTFLVKNKFDEVQPYVFCNGRCLVRVTAEGFEIEYISNGEKGTVYWGNHSVYWLIGFLVYHNLADSDFVTCLP